MELVDLMPLHPLLRHPHTGEPLRAIFQLEDGEYLWPLLGADGEGDEGGDEGEDNNDDDNEDEESEEEDSEEDKGSKSKSKKTGTVSKDEHDRVVARMKAADKNRAEAQKKLDELERKGKGELENTKADLEKATKAHESLQSKFTTLALTNAFLIASQQAGIAWHDPKVAQNAANLKDLEIDDDGNVEGIEAVVKKLAKDKAFLVNKGKADEDEDDGEPNGTKRRGASGSGVGSTKTPKGKPANGKLTDEQLKARFPALR